MNPSDDFEERIARRLRDTRQLEAAPEGFAAEVTRRVRRNAKVPDGASALPFAWLRMAMAGGVALLLMMIVLREQEPKQAEVPPALAAQNELKLTIPAIPTERLAALPGRVDEPLEAELRSLISDTRNAVDYLAATFLPQRRAD